MINGVKIIQLKKIPDERGTVYHMIKASNGHFTGFGEIYFSKIYPNAVKGWHKNDAVLNYVCVVGSVKLVIYDNREGSVTRGEVQEIFIGEDNYCLVQIPANVWDGFKAIGGKTAMICNCCEKEHGKFKSKRVDPYNNDFPYKWKRKDE